jgi:hypothetical protein
MKAVACIPEFMIPRLGLNPVWLTTPTGRAILFWDCFQGHRLHGTEFQNPERPENLPSLKPLENWPKFNPRDPR